MKTTRNRTGTGTAQNAEFDDWRERYDAAIAAYEEMAERRRVRKLERRAQARRDAVLREEYEIEQRYIARRPTDDPLAMYLRHRMEASVLVWQFLSWAAATAGNAFLASTAVGMVRRRATQTINHVEKLLWRTKKKLEQPVDTRSIAERERRKIRRRSTLAQQPTPDDIRKEWLVANRSCRDIIAFGAVIHDLECYVDNSLGFDEEGNIVGRATGILGWLRENVPELAVRYKTIMRYKSIAKRCRQYLGLVDPEPLNPDDPKLAELLGDCPATQKDVRERLDEALAKRNATSAETISAE